jgi:hypothetical protein
MNHKQKWKCVKLENEVPDYIEVSDHFHAVWSTPPPLLLLRDLHIVPLPPWAPHSHWRWELQRMPNVVAISTYDAAKPRKLTLLSRMCNNSNTLRLPLNLSTHCKLSLGSHIYRHTEWSLFCTFHRHFIPSDHKNLFFNGSFYERSSHVERVGAL